MKTYIMTLKHDTGKTKVKVTASNLETAINMVVLAENCPRRAIVKTQQIK